MNITKQFISFSRNEREKKKKEVLSDRLQKDLKAARKVKMMKDRLTNSKSIAPCSGLLDPYKFQDRIHNIKIKE